MKSTIETMTAEQLGVPSRAKTMEREGFKQGARHAGLQQLVNAFHTALRDTEQKYSPNGMQFRHRGAVVSDGVAERFYALVVEQGWWASIAHLSDDDGIRMESVVTVWLMEPMKTVTP